MQMGVRWFEKEKNLVLNGHLWNFNIGWISHDFSIFMDDFYFIKNWNRYL